MTKRFGRRHLGAVALAALILPAFLPGKGAFAATSAEELEPSGLAGTYLAARTADVDKDIPSAAAFYRAALQSDPDSLFLLERALILTAASGDVEQALGFAGQLVEKAPTSHVSRLVMAVDQIRAGKFSEAVATLEDRSEERRVGKEG